LVASVMGAGGDSAQQPAGDFVYRDTPVDEAGRSGEVEFKVAPPAPPAPPAPEAPPPVANNQLLRLAALAKRLNVAANTRYQDHTMIVTLPDGRAYDVYLIIDTAMMKLDNLTDRLDSLEARFAAATAA